MTKDKIKGCLLGGAFGDAMGACYEGGWLERALWKLIGKSNGRMRYTDDTQMSLDIVHSLLSQKRLEPDHLAMTFANSYQWSRGYGPGAAKTLKQINKGIPWQQANTYQFNEGSYGNGAAMRAPVLALFYSEQELKQKVSMASQITHAHPEAVEGALLVAMTAKMALNDKDNHQIVTKLHEISELQVYREKINDLELFINHQNPRLADIPNKLGNSIQAKNSSVSAIAYALYFRNNDYLTMFEAIKKAQGDVDTIAAMAGAIWGCFNGASSLPNIEIESKESLLKLVDEIDAYIPSNN